MNQVVNTPTRQPFREVTNQPPASPRTPKPKVKVAQEPVQTKPKPVAKKPAANALHEPTSTATTSHPSYAEMIKAGKTKS